MDQAFLEHIFDCTITNEIKSSIISENGNVSIQNIFTNPFLQFQSVFGSIWFSVFRNFPTTQDFIECCNAFQCSFQKPLPLAALNKDMVAKISMYLSQITNLQISADHIDISTMLNPNSTMMYIVKKWSHRFMMEFPKDKNIFEAFKIMVKHALNKRREYDPKYFELKDGFAVDIITGNLVECFPSPGLFWTDFIQYVHMKNRYFQRKLFSEPAISIWDGISCDKDVILGIQHVTKVFKKRPIIFTTEDISGVNATFPSQMGMFVSYAEDLWHIIPKIGRFHMHISSELIPEVTGLSRDENHNVFWSVCPDRIDVPTTQIKTMRFNKMFCSDTTTSYSQGRYQIYFEEEFWKLHLSESEGQDNAISKLVWIDRILRHRHSLQKEIQALWDVKRKEDDTPPENAFICLDNRPNEMTVLSMLVALTRVENLAAWRGIVYTTQRCVDYYKEVLPLEIVDVEVLPSLEVDAFDIDVYNESLEHAGLWQKLKDKEVKKVVTIQDDGLLMNKGVEKFLEWDYIGAPWLDAPQNDYIKKYINSELVGNGGLSVRSVDWMLKICEERQAERLTLFYHNLVRIPEDVYYVKWLKRGGAKMPSGDVARKFAVEQILDADALGMHKLWLYHNPQTLETFFDKFLLTQ